MIKELWAKTTYFLFIAILIIVGLFSGDIKVKASEITNWTTAQTRITTNFNGQNSTTSWASGTTTYNLTNPINRIEYRFSYSGGLSNQNTYTFNIGYVPNPDAIYPVGITLNAGSATTLDYSCTTFTRDSVPTYKVSCTFTPNSSLSSSQYIYAIIDFYEGYLSSIRGSYTGFDERKGTNAVITEQTNNIIDAGNQNTQLIIDNMSNDCSNILPTSTSWYGNTYSISGNTITINNSSWAFYTNINVKANTTYYFSYKTSKSIWNIVQNNDGTTDLIDWSQTKSRTFNTGNNTNIRVLFNVSTDTGPIDISEIMISEENKPFCVYGSKINKIDDTTNAINGVDDTLNDDDIESPSDFFDDFNDMLPTNNTISSLIALPITLYTKVLNSINGTCSSITLGSLYNTNLVMPCINISTYLGSTLWNLIDIIISGLFVYAISKKMVKVFENFTSMKEGDVIGD